MHIYTYKIKRKHEEQTNSIFFLPTRFFFVRTVVTVRLAITILSIRNALPVATSELVN